MDTNDYKTYTEKLKQELALLEKELSATGRKNPDHPGDWEAKPDELDIQASDENEVADKLESYESNEVILNQLEARYNQVKNALTRIEEKAFGICKICQKPIEKERLEANPAAETCIDHKNE